MAKAGRKRKTGKRERNGRIQRVSPYDRGTERVQAMQALYGPDGADAIGRAFRSGLLGEGSEAKAILDVARSISNAYWIAFETGGITCTLADKTSGSVVSLDHEKIRRREVWLKECLKLAKEMGDDVLKAFHQLAIDVNPECGPVWLDRLCWVWAQNKGRKPEDRLEYDRDDMDTLRAALDALELLAT